VESGRVELRGLGSSWNLSQELDSVGMGAEDVGSGLRARAAEGLERTGIGRPVETGIGSNVRKDASQCGWGRVRKGGRGTGELWNSRGIRGRGRGVRWGGCGSVGCGRRGQRASCEGGRRLGADGESGERWRRGSGAMFGKLRVSAGGEGSERENGGRAIIGGGSSQKNKL
jgi:hypothetical protein